MSGRGGQASPARWVEAYSSSPPGKKCAQVVAPACCETRMGGSTPAPPASGRCGRSLRPRVGSAATAACRRTTSRPRRSRRRRSAAAGPPGRAPRRAAAGRRPPASRRRRSTRSRGRPAERPGGQAQRHERDFTTDHPAAIPGRTPLRCPVSPRVGGAGRRSARLALDRRPGRAPPPPRRTWWWWSRSTRCAPTTSSSSAASGRGA